MPYLSAAVAIMFKAEERKETLLVTNSGARLACYNEDCSSVKFVHSIFSGKLVERSQPQAQASEVWIWFEPLDGLSRSRALRTLVVSI